VCACVCACVWACVWACVCVDMFVCMCVWACVWACVCMCVHMCAHVWCPCVCACVGMCTALASVCRPPPFPRAGTRPPGVVPVALWPRHRGWRGVLVHVVCFRWHWCCSCSVVELSLADVSGGGSVQHSADALLDRAAHAIVVHAPCVLHVRRCRVLAGAGGGNGSGDPDAVNDNVVLARALRAVAALVAAGNAAWAGGGAKAPSGLGANVGATTLGTPVGASAGVAAAGLPPGFSWGGLDDARALAEPSEAASVPSGAGSGSSGGGGARMGGSGDVPARAPRPVVLVVSAESQTDISPALLSLFTHEVLHALASRCRPASRAPRRPGPARVLVSTPACPQPQVFMHASGVAGPRLVPNDGRLFRGGAGATGCVRHR
jgi:hypothetical protein